MSRLSRFYFGCGQQEERKETVWKIKIGERRVLKSKEGVGEVPLLLLQRFRGIMILVEFVVKLLKNTFPPMIFTLNNDKINFQKTAILRFKRNHLEVNQQAHSRQPQRGQASENE